MQSVKKLLLIFPRVPYPVMDGGAVAMYNLIKGLSGCEGIQLSLFFLNTSKHFVDPKEIEKQFSGFGEINSIYIRNEITIGGAVKNLFSSKSYIISRFISEPIVVKLKKVLNEGDFDVIHVDGLQVANYIGVIEQYKKNAKVVLRQHNIEHLIWERLASNAGVIKKPYLKVQSKRLKAFELDVIQRFDAVLPITHIDEDFFRSEGIKNTYVLPAGIIQGDNFTSKLGFGREKQTKFFHLGSMDWEPNREGLMWFLTSVWPKIHAKFPGVTFYAAGKGMPEEFYDFDNLNNVHVVGEVEDAKLFSEKHDVKIVPLKSGSGLRIKVIEAMGMGKPVISTSIGLEGIPVKDKEQVLVANSDADFVKAIDYVVNNPENVVEMGLRAQELMKSTYSLKKITEGLISYYNSLVL